MERRPELLSSVMLRQNPHNVHEWHKRVKLFNGQPHKQILTFTEAVTTVEMDKVCCSVFLYRSPEKLGVDFIAFLSLTTPHLLPDSGCGKAAHAVDWLCALL